MADVTPGNGPELEGTELGTELGQVVVGTALGTELGTELGNALGNELGTELGTELGMAVGMVDGMTLGLAEGPNKELGTKLTRTASGWKLLKAPLFIRASISTNTRLASVVELFPSVNSVIDPWATLQSCDANSLGMVQCTAPTRV